ncbi:hypothetical protein [Pontibacter vulgaris]|uniref:hypothetical protein n=1 Tax=Pontibacter vulgaris TaxID=2905679 RepID=UPI001FA72159|nr:hypothetical protein [Pontibacter vulgaris]
MKINNILSERKSVLILSYFFPPHPSIGGRRWAKFSKYLYRNNIEISVYSQRPFLNHSNKVSPWLNDTFEYKDKIQYFDLFYPSVINKDEYSFIDKIYYRLTLLYLKAKFKGNIYDPTLFVNEDFLNQIRNSLTSNKFKNVIVTGGPFTWLTDIIDLKKEFPHIKFIVDFRDPWCNNLQSFGYAELSKSRMNYELQLEAKVVRSFDIIISVSKEMNTYFIDNYSLNLNKFITIPNGYDKDDYAIIKQSITNHETLRFIHAGTLFEKIDYIFKELVDALDHLRDYNKEIYNIIRFDFYGDVPKYFLDATKHHKNIVYHGVVPLDEVYKSISTSDVCILFLTKGLGYALITKFHEYISQQKTLALFSERCWTSNFIQEHNLGYSLTEGGVYNGLIEIYSDWKNKSLKQNLEFDSSEFDIENLVYKLIEILD